MAKIRSISLKVALKDCYRIWTWLADNPEKDKDDNPLVLKNGYVNDCPMCQYVEAVHGANTATGWIKKGEDSPCCYCPLKALWPRGCMDEDSPYNKWVDLQDKLNWGDYPPMKEKTLLGQITRVATRIANAAKKVAEKEGISLG